MMGDPTPQRGGGPSDGAGDREGAEARGRVLQRA